MPLPVDNPPNPWHSAHVELLGPPPEAALRVYEEDAKSIITDNSSPDIPYRFGVNPYRGCFHGCAYCYALPTHQYLDWGMGSDFERRIVVKRNAAELLRDELARRRGPRDWLVFSGITDCYQPLEAVYRLTRSCLEVCVEFRNPVSIISKGVLVERDIDLLLQLQDRAPVMVYISVPFALDEDGRAVEPFAPPPSRRLQAIGRLADAGIPVGVSVAPLIPGLSDRQLPEILAEAKARGAQRATMSLLHLTNETLALFEERLRRAMPQAAERVLSALEDYRPGRGRTETRFGHRMRGSGPRWQLTQQLFELTCRKVGLEMLRVEDSLTTTEPRMRQGELF